MFFNLYIPVVEVRDFVATGENRANEASEKNSWGGVRGARGFDTYQVQIGAISYYALRHKKMQINTVKFSSKIYM